MEHALQPLVIFQKNKPMHRVVPGTDSTTSPVKKFDTSGYSTTDYYSVKRLKSSWDSKATYEKGQESSRSKDNNDLENTPQSQNSKEEKEPRVHERHSVAESARLLAQKLEKTLLHRGAMRSQRYIMMMRLLQNKACWLCI